MKKVVVLGSTGSIGRQTLDVIRQQPDQFEVVGISGKANLDLLREQCSEFHPEYVAGPDAPCCDFGTARFLQGNEGVEELACLKEADIVVNGISGFSALVPLISSLKAGKTVALANKESIVCGKKLIDQLILDYHGSIIPVDSEQSALFQCMLGKNDGDIRKLILTASGGKFWKRELDDLNGITVEEASENPNWSMGLKITIDSSTLFNKGLEVIEASYLFDVPAEKIEVIIHPQSIIHSMVEYKDGSVFANMSVPDMRIPIQFAMTYPDRAACPAKFLNFADLEQLSFYKASKDRFPALRMAYDALSTGKSAPIVYNAANEEAVKSFIKKEIRFTEIYEVVEETLEKSVFSEYDSVGSILEKDAAARDTACSIIERIRNRKQK